MATNIAHLRPNIAHSGTDFMRLMDVVRDDAALALDACLDGISQQKVRSARVPSASVTFLSRAKNGADSNPLYRIAAVFVLMKRLGLGRERAQRIIGWLQEIVDELWPDTEAELNKALDTDQQLDPEDDTLRYQARLGDADARRKLLEVKRKQMAHDAVVIDALRNSLGGDL